MRGWIIKLLGGVSFYDHAIALRKIDRLEYDLRRAVEDAESEKMYEALRHQKQYHFIMEYDVLRGHNFIMHVPTREVYVPKSLLEQARKNDTPRDSKTGRFVKKKSGRA